MLVGAPRSQRLQRHGAVHPDAPWHLVPAFVVPDLRQHRQPARSQRALPDPARADQHLPHLHRGERHVSDGLVRPFHKLAADGAPLIWLGPNFWSRSGAPLMWRSYDPTLVREELAV